MASEDIVQVSDLAYVDYSIAGAVLTANKEVGGLVTRIGVGQIQVALPQAVDINDVMAEFISKEGAGTFASAAIDVTNSTATNIRIDVFDAAGAAVDNISGAIRLSKVF